MNKNILAITTIGISVAPLAAFSTYQVYNSLKADKILDVSEKNFIKDVAQNIVTNSYGKEKTVESVISILNDIKYKVQVAPTMNNELHSADNVEEIFGLNYANHFLEALSIFDLSDESIFDNEDDKTLPNDISIESVINDIVERSIEIADESYSTFTSNLDNSESININESMLGIGSPDVTSSVPPPSYTSIEVGDIIDFWNYQWNDTGENGGLGEAIVGAVSNTFIGHTSLVIDSYWSGGVKVFKTLSSKPSTEGVYETEIKANDMGEYLSENGGLILRVGKTGRYGKWWEIWKWKFLYVSETEKKNYVGKVQSVYKDYKGKGYDYDLKLDNGLWYCSEIPGEVYSGTAYEFTKWNDVYAPRGISMSSKTKVVDF